MFGLWPRLPIDFVFPTHEVMGTLRPVDNYVTELISALRKAFEVTRNITQMEALRQKQRQRVTKYTWCATKSTWMCQCTSSKINEVEGKPFTKMDFS